MKKITVILLVVSLMLCSAFVACSKAPCETHTYVDGKCSVCEIECEHASFEDGACKECGKTCSHVGGTATCTEKKECTTCGAKYGEKDTANHTGEEKWQKTAYKHSKVWSCCNVIALAEENHDWDDGACKDCEYQCMHVSFTDEICDLCGSTCKHESYSSGTCDGCGKVCSSHTGGTATCTTKKECTTCGVEYGEKDATNHTGSENWVKTADKHSKEWSCCNAVVLAEENHDWDDGVCLDCEYVCEHTTYTNGYCLKCNKACEHADGVEEWHKTASKHSKKWSCCNAVVLAEENHDWDDGVCLDCEYVCEHTTYTNGYCLKCNKACEHADGVEEWHKTASKHSKKWSCCNAVVLAEENHDWDDGACSDCGYACEHLDYTNGVCVECGKVCEHESFVDGKCVNCGNPCVHTFEEGVCSACGYKQVVIRDGATMATEDGILVYTITGGGGKVSFQNIEGKKWLSFDIKMTTTLGYAYIQPGYNDYSMNVDILKIVKKADGTKVVFTETGWTGANAMEEDVWYTVLVDTSGNNFYTALWSEVTETKIANIKFLDIATTAGDTLTINSVNGQPVYTLVKKTGENCNSYGDNAFWFTTGDAQTLTFDFYSDDFNYIQFTSGDGTGYVSFDHANKVEIIDITTGEPVAHTELTWTGEVLTKGTWYRITADVDGITDLGVCFWSSEAGEAQIKNIELK